MNTHLIGTKFNCIFKEQSIKPDQADPIKTKLLKKPTPQPFAHNHLSKKRYQCIKIISAIIYSEGDREERFLLNWLILLWDTPYKHLNSIKDERLPNEAKQTKMG